MLAALLLVAVTAAAVGQANVPTVENTGTVYVYRYGQFIGKALRPSVYCDDQEVAQIQSGREFAIALKPGRHIFRSSDKQAVATIDVTPGQNYFVRVDIATGFLKGSGRVVLVPIGQGQEEVKRLQPSDRDRILDFDRISLHAFDGPAPSATLSADGHSATGGAQAVGRPISNDDVIALVQSGLSDAAVTTKINNSRTSFRLDPDDLVALRKAGVSSEVIQAMLSPR
jgi:hypothetical protein